MASKNGEWYPRDRDRFAGSNQYAYQSQSSTLDKIVQRILKKLSSANVKLELKKIPTKKNPMDAPSRNKAMQWSTLLEHLTSFVREGSTERERGLTE